jgi:hypothetical protein
VRWENKKPTFRPSEKGFVEQQLHSGSAQLIHSLQNVRKQKTQFRPSEKGFVEQQLPSGSAKLIRLTLKREREEFLLNYNLRKTKNPISPKRKGFC